MDTHVSRLRGVGEDTCISREEGRVELTRSGNEESIQWIGKGGAGDEAGVNRHASRQLCQADTGTIQRRLDPLFRRLRQPQASRSVERDDLEQRRRRDADRFPHFGL